MQEAGLRIAAGTIHMWLGNFEEASQALESGLELLPVGASQLRATALENLGVVAAEGNGETDRAITLTEEALSLSRQIHDHFKTAEILSTLGTYRFNAGDWPGALADLHQAHALAQQINSDKMLAAVELNLGAVGIDADPDNYADVQAHLEIGLALARKTSQSIFESICLTKLAELMIRQEKWTAAEEFLTQAHALATEIGDQLTFPIIARGWAQVRLGQGDAPAALADACRSVDLCRENGEPVELGISLRVLGQVYGVLAQPQEAEAAFRESLVVLGDSYPRERERTQIQRELGGG